MKIKFNPEHSMITDIWLGGCSISIESGAMIPLEFCSEQPYSFKEKETCEMNGLHANDLHMVPVKISAEEYLIDDLGENFLPIGEYIIEGKKVFLAAQLINSVLPLEMFTRYRYTKEGESIEINMPACIRSHEIGGRYKDYPCDIHLLCLVYQQSIADRMFAFQEALDQLVTVIHQTVEEE